MQKRFEDNIIADEVTPTASARRVQPNKDVIYAARRWGKWRPERARRGSTAVTMLWW